MESRTSTGDASPALKRAAEMRDVYMSGATLQEVGTRYNLSRERVRQIFDQYGYPVRTVREVTALKRASEQDRVGEILAMYSELGDVREVAGRLHVSQRTVRDLVRAAQLAGPQAASKVRRKFSTQQKRYSDEELIQCLKVASQKIGGILTTQAYDEFARGQSLDEARPWPRHQACSLRFGSWTDSLHRAGLCANPSSAIAGQRLFTAGHCIDAIRHVVRMLGHVPTAIEYDNLARASDGALPSLATVRQRCGGWLDALCAAGF